MGLPDNDIGLPCGEGLFLNLNEGARELPQAIRDEVLERMRERDWRRYPDRRMRVCRRLIAERHGVDEACVLLGNGSNELLGASMLAFAKPGGGVFWLRPGFSMVPKMAAMLGRRLVGEPFGAQDFAFPPFTGSTAMHGVDMVVLASPNNPTGVCLPEDLFADLMARFSGPVVMDEAYGEFSGHSFTGFLERYPNLLVLKTFSKAFSLAGGRIGYALSSKKMIERLESCVYPFSLGLFAQTCVEVLCRQSSWPDDAVLEICRERDGIVAALQRLSGFKVIPSQANFILFSPGTPRFQALKKKLDDQKVRLRTFDEPLLADWFRVTVGTAKENRLFLKTVSAFARELGE